MFSVLLRGSPAVSRESEGDNSSEKAVERSAPAKKTNGKKSSFKETEGTVN